MELILKDGISTKHCPNNTCESIMLSLYNKKISGIYLNIFKSKDNVLVVSSVDKIFNKKITENNYFDLLKLNLGSKVKKHCILTLKEVFEIYNNSNNKIILKPFDDTIIDDINELASNYNVNMMIEANNKNEYRNNICRVGINLNINNLSYIHYDYDFYIVNFKSLKDFLQIYKFRTIDEIIFYNIKNKNDYEKLKEITKNYLGNISILIDDYSLHYE